MGLKLPVILATLSAFLAGLLLLNVSVNGLHCWGFSPGGRISIGLYGVQIVFLLCSWMLLLRRVTLQKSRLMRAILLSVIIFTFAVNLYVYTNISWFALTSGYMYGYGGFIGFSSAFVAVIICCGFEVFSQPSHRKV